MSEIIIINLLFRKLSGQIRFHLIKNRILSLAINVWQKYFNCRNDFVITFDSAKLNRMKKVFILDTGEKHKNGKNWMRFDDK
ncbi:MAG TPA: hypothetical protein GXX14_12885 [Clostridiaceae bacterium]|nr:hypothetical protein [Clostridiaceae bacterium]